jgi:serine/threonine-protein kinase
MLYRITGDFEESARIFRKLLDDQPTSPAWVGLGQTNVAQGKFESAEIAFQSAIEREPGNWSNRMALAEFLYWRGRYEEALEALRRVIELRPDNARAYLLMGASYDYLGDTKASLEATLQSIKLSPTRGAYRDLGLTYYYLGDYQQAVDAYTRAVDLGPDDHWSWGSLADAYRALGGHEEAARAAYGKASELATAVMKRNDRDWVTLARLAVYNVVNGDIDLGEKEITVAVAKGAHVDEVHFYDAVIHMELGQQELTLDALQRAIDLGFPVRLIARDPQFNKLRNNERFRTMIGEQ